MNSPSLTEAEEKSLSYRPSPTFSINSSSVFKWIRMKNIDQSSIKFRHFSIKMDDGSEKVISTS